MIDRCGADDVVAGGAASDSGGVGVGATVVPGVDLACSSVRDTCVAGDVVAGGAASDSGGFGVDRAVPPVHNSHSDPVVAGNSSVLLIKICVVCKVVLSTTSGTLRVVLLCVSKDSVVSCVELP